ncbi:MAG: HU family DNA-binding protein [Tannerellaceae bacterium]|jgi:DNA-binding protein HU-beta|nr:HU family DNA-binding protein [Tannerellaceae bacterium]
MKNKELIKELADRLNWTPDEVSDVISKLGSIISTRLADDDIVYLERLGQFETRKKGERVSVNPANGKRYLVPPKLVPVFKPGITIKTKLKELANNE